MAGTLWDDFSSLPGHEVQELVDHEGRRESLNTSLWDRSHISADRTWELVLIPGDGGNYPGKAVKADGVGAGKQFGSLVGSIVGAQASGTR